MCNQNEWIVREAFLAYNRGDLPRMMEFVDQDLEYEKALLRQADLGLRTELEQVIAAGEKVMLVMRTPGVDKHRHWQAGDVSFDVATVRDGMIVALHACRDRGEAQSLAGIA